MKQNIILSWLYFKSNVTHKSPSLLRVLFLREQAKKGSTVTHWYQSQTTLKMHGSHGFPYIFEYNYNFFHISASFFLPEERTTDDESPLAADIDLCIHIHQNNQKWYSCGSSPFLILFIYENWVCLLIYFCIFCLFCWCMYLRFSGEINRYDYVLTMFDLVPFSNRY